MIIVTGAIIARPGQRDPLIEAALAHVGRSRAERGCISHDVHVDLNAPDRLFFFERWESVAALQAHAAQPGTLAFMAAIREHAASTEPLAVYEASEVAR